MQVMRGESTGRAAKFPQYRRPEWTSSRGCSWPPATVTAPPSCTRSGRARPTCGAWRRISSAATTPTTSPRTPSCGPGGPSPRSAATPAPARGSSPSPAAPAPTRCAAKSAGAAWPAAPEPRRPRPGPAARPATTPAATPCTRWSTACRDDQRIAFVLTQVVGCSYAEAAEVCGVPVGTIRSRVARGPRAVARRSARRRHGMSRLRLRVRSGSPSRWSGPSSS